MPTVDPSAYPIDLAVYRAADHGWLDELDGLAVHVGPPHQRMGTRVIDHADWLRPDQHRDRELGLKRRLFREAHGEVLGVLPGSEAASAEVAALVGDWVGTHGGGHGSRSGRAALDVERAPDNDLDTGHPLVRAALLVQEDLCLMQRDATGWRLTAAALCFPTYWRLADKLGRPQQDLHAPVPHYGDDLAAKVDRFFDRLSPDRIVARRNWGFSAHPLLFVPDLEALAPPGGFDVEQLWLRSERQTLRRLAQSGGILFTIRVQLAPGEALLSRPMLAARLLAAMEAWSPQLVAARGGRHGWFDQLTQWLRTISAR